MIRFIREAALIVVLAVLLGLGIHFGEVRTFLRGGFGPGFTAAAETAGIVFIGLAEADDLFAKGEALFIDAREEGPFGRGHILNARNVPAEENKARLAEPLDLPPEKLLVVYCDGGECLSSLALAKVLRTAGYKNVRVFSGGFAEWSAAGLPQQKGGRPGRSND
jgi:rhodanese-related sulfurtransferase